MKIIFLDVDGVLNSEVSRDDNSQVDEHFCPKCCHIFNKILQFIPDVKLVISSSIRKCYSFEELKELFVKNLDVNPDAILGITPSLDGIRGDEILHWLNQNPDVSRFVILDDNDDMGELMGNLVKTSFHCGIKEEDVIKAISLLK